MSETGDHSAAGALADERAGGRHQEGGGAFRPPRLASIVAGRLRRLGGLARAVAAGAGAQSFHHHRRPQRQAAARLCDGRRPLAAAGRCQDRASIPDISSCCWPMKTAGSSRMAASIRWRWAARRFSSCTRGHIVSGGSTITMQLARLMEPRRERSVYAKLRQMVRAVQIERQLSKDQILDLYLALAPFGGNLEGIRAASIAYFGKEPKRLSLAEAALLVALPQSPETPPARPLSGSRARRARPRARRAWSRTAWCRTTTRRRPRRWRCRGCASRCRSWRRIPPIRRWRR